MNNMDQVDHTVKGTVGSCILKVLLLALTKLHCNDQKQKGIYSYMNFGTCCIHTVRMLGLTQSRFILMVFSLIARRWARPQYSMTALM